MNQEREPLYIQIQNHFKERITSRELVEDQKIPTEKELMDEFGVSRITVVNALVELAKDGWIYRIPGRGTYIKGIPESQIADKAVAAFAAEPPVRAGGMRIGLVFPTLEDYFAVRLIRGVTDELQAQGYSLHIMLTNNSKEKEKEVIRELKTTVDGLIIFPVDAEVYNEEIISLKMQNYPFVLIDRHLPGVETNVVASDSPRASALAVDHLWELGHRNIAICTDSPMMTVSVDERIQGYFDALKQKGAMINPALILNDFELDMDQINRPDAPAKEIDATHPLYRFMQNRMATAYIALNCSLGVQMLSIARKVGLRVPEDISIVTFDNPTPLFEELSLLTHIDQSEYKMGSEAVKLLMQAIENAKRNQKEFRKITLDPRLVTCKTTGPAPSAE
ncbi:GntR family transcriptional regulator [Saccharibacillus endophyticus]|uniref:Arabinose metabolism transcriptional repressor n=1 Tax=Saccharibacillus endophyticus TaxID=2060666 RepID=A0ABQ1ZXL8_9BACL|nr:GntR family transcriptional regulator [Saccharibacillus endophyticus]GGH79621.1 arabinose metabolism transcriptional repressor [Saccharibacillus endophyticus]